MSRRELALLAAVVGLAAVHMALYATPFEDAYITFRYVDNLVGGHGLSFNPGQRVEGFTSFGWVMLLALARLAKLSLPLVAPLLSAMCGLALVALTGVIARRLMRPSRYLWLAPPLWLAATGTWAYWSMTGMETTCFSLVVTLAVLFALREGRGAAIGAGLLFGVSALLRPEGVGYFGVVALALFTLPAARRRIAPLSLAFALVFVPYFAWRYHYFGYLLPNTYYAKASPTLGHLWRGVFQLEHFLTLHLLWLVPVAAYLLVRAERGSHWLRLAIFVFAGACIDVLLVGGDSFAFYRFFLPALPWALLLLVEGGRRVGERLSEARPALAARAKPLSAAAVVLYAALCVAVAFVPPVTLTGGAGKPTWEQLRDVAHLDQQYFLVGRWLRAHFPPHTTIALNAAGIVPYESGLPAIDMLGLNDVHIAHHHVTTRGAPGHEKHDAAYVLSKRPDIIIPGLPILSRRRLQRGDLVPWFARFFPYLPGDQELFQSPEFLKDYSAISLPVDHYGWFTFFVRQGVPLPHRHAPHGYAPHGHAPHHPAP